MDWIRLITIPADRLFFENNYGLFRAGSSLTPFYAHSISAEGYNFPEGAPAEPGGQGGTGYSPERAV